MAALSAYAFPEDAGYDADLRSAAWRDAVRGYALGRPAHAVALPRRWQRWGWLLAVALHLLILVAMRSNLREQQRLPESSVISVELIDAPAVEPPLPEPSGTPAPPPTTAARPSAMPRPPVARLPAPPPAAAAEASPEFHAYNPDGSLDIPGDLAAQLDNAEPRADFIPLKVAPSPILNPRRPLKIRPNHFAQYWNGTDGMPLHESMWRYVTATKEFVAPWGGRYGCTWILILVACADVPDKPWNPPQQWSPATELDER
ncbi:MAG TPA: hypothetical protein VHQ21_16950 [Rhodanobacteraceae bacterium]|nr:hypothetical protein [Rhodanobacteraceae bacterium]